MKRRFKAKKKIKLASLLIFVVLLMVMIFSFSVIKRFDPLFLLTQDYRLFTLDFDRNDYLLKNGFKIIEESSDMPVFEEKLPEEPVIRKKIYVYNTHQAERYADYNVLEAAFELKKMLNDYQIDVIVEETNIPEEVKKHNYTYSQSYRVTKELLSKHLQEGISLFIDLHRDSAAKNATTATIGDKNYAKLMFVVGGNHDNYMNNYRVSDGINKMIKNNAEVLSRGLLLRKSSNYNQEVDGNVILIELGGPDNTREEVNNTLSVLAKSIFEYLEE